MSFEMDAGDLHVSLLKDSQTCRLSREQKDMLVTSPSSFELIVVKHLDFPRMDNQERYLCRQTGVTLGVTLEIVDVLPIVLLGGSYQEILEDFSIHSSFAVDILPTNNNMQ
ncbi:hypothetical protein PoB_006352300 [Plakobranchus ocellatus]|uniref:Uncharacterized protein n=1 Tax=Plakobranchus ocellatus TaxID=259542 RepID=A0AAV4CYL1_9GAST|nr:hypothetical protein PoB_006352300 [Plakobranchus ocellatus]